MKKMISMFAAMAVALSAMTAPVMAVTYAGVEVNGVKVQFEQDPVIENSRVLVPFRFVAESLGAEVSWDAETKTASCEKDGVAIDLTVNADDAVVSGQAVAIDVPAKIINSRVFVPLRFIAENMDADVAWDAENKTVKINVTAETTTEETTEATTEEVTKSTDEVESPAAVDFESYVNEDYNAKVTYPVFSGDKAAVNASIKKAVVDKANAYVADAEKADDVSKNEYSNDVVVSYDGEKGISVVSTEYIYTGGAHGSTTVASAVYDPETFEEVTVDSKLMDKAIEQFKAMITDADSEMFEDAEKDITADNIGWYIDADGQNVFYINEAIVAPYSAGVISTVVE